MSFLMMAAFGRSENGKKQAKNRRTAETTSVHSIRRPRRPLPTNEEHGNREHHPPPPPNPKRRLLKVAFCGEELARRANPEADRKERKSRTELPDCAESLGELHSPGEMSEQKSRWIHRGGGTRALELKLRRLQHSRLPGGIKPRDWNERRGPYLTSSTRNWRAAKPGSSSPPGGVPSLWAGLLLVPPPHPTPPHPSPPGRLLRARAHKRTQ